MKLADFLKKYKFEKKLKQINRKKYNIGVVYHKPWSLLENDVVTPVHAGRDIAMNAAKDGMLSVNDFDWMMKHMVGDNSSVNISDKNRYFAENTVTYWMWKNIKSPYLGLMHYRRIFDVSGGESVSQKSRDLLRKFGLSRKNLDKIFSEYDIILPKKLGFDISIYEQYAKWHMIEDLDFCLSYIDERYPDISPYAKKIKTSNIGYFYNMFIADRDIVNDYAEFLFDVLFAFSRQVKDREARPIYQQRAEGYLAERLTGIYFDYLINTKNLKVKELPVVSIEDKTSKKHINIIRFNARNDKGKGITLVLRIKL